MEKQEKSLFSKVIHNPWFITLISTMLGIMLGIYLSNLNEKRLLLKGKNQALEKVLKELEENEEMLKGFNDTLQSKYESMSYIIPWINEDFDLIIHKDSLESFIAKSKFMFTYTGHEELPNDQLDVSGELEFYISSNLIFSDLSDIIWDAYKQMDYLSVTEFDCLTALETIYQFQQEVNVINSEWREIFFKRKFLGTEEDRSDFLNIWETMLLKQKLLLQAYEGKENLFENCQ